MKKSGTSKKVLLMSLLSLVMCCAMLVGSTFAWFTDSVTSGENKIVAGVLDVDLYHSQDWEGFTKVEDSTKLFGDGWDSNNSHVVGDDDPISIEKWEPGVLTYDMAAAYVLDLEATCPNYVEVEGVKKDLRDVLKVAVEISGNKVAHTGGGGSSFDPSKLTFVPLSEFAGYNGYVLPDDSGTLYYGDPTPSRFFTIYLYWEPSDADDTYNLKNGKKAQNYADDLETEDPLSVNVSVNLTATQHPYEVDSNGSSSYYDRNAMDKLMNAKNATEADLKKLTVNMTFNNGAFSELKTAELMGMTVKIDGSHLATPITATIGSDGTVTGGGNTLFTKDSTITYDAASKTISFTVMVPKDGSYKVQASGAGYRTFTTSSFVLTDDATVTVWDNAKSSAAEVVKVGAETKQSAQITMLAGDINNDGTINSDDLNPVKLHFGATVTASTVRYDVNRDGKIDSSDTSRINVSWGK